MEALEEKKEDIERKIATHQSAEDYSDAMAAKMTELYQEKERLKSAN